jgi:hypothetical protein
MLLQLETPVLTRCEFLPARRCWTATGLHIEVTFGDLGGIADPVDRPESEESNVLDYFSNPQPNPQHALSCVIFNDLSGPWQSPRSCKLL